jgi:hypothetical protein
LSGINSPAAFAFSGVRHDACPNWVEFDVTHQCQQILLAVHHRRSVRLRKLADQQLSSDLQAVSAT